MDEFPSVSFVWHLYDFDPGLAGTLGVSILDDEGAIVTARSTAGIAAVGSSGDYDATLTSPNEVGTYTLYADDGDGVDASETLNVTLTPSAGVAGLFASPDELAARLGITMDADEQARATLLLGVATGLIVDAAAGQQIVYVADDVLTMPGTTDERILLPQRPVVSIASITLDGTALVEGTDWWLDRNTLVRIPATTIVALTGIHNEMLTYPLWSGFGWPAQTLEITYTHGYDPAPLTVKAVCLEACVRVWVNPGSVARETIGAESTVYDNNRFAPSGLMLTDDEKRTIRRMFGRTMSSVTVAGM